MGLRHIWHVTYSTMYFRRSDSMYLGTYLPVRIAILIHSKEDKSRCTLSERPKAYKKQQYSVNNWCQHLKTTQDHHPPRPWKHLTHAPNPAKRLTSQHQALVSVDGTFRSQLRHHEGEHVLWLPLHQLADVLEVCPQRLRGRRQQGQGAWTQKEKVKHLLRSTTLGVCPRWCNIEWGKRFRYNKVFYFDKQNNSGHLMNHL